jgi:hypothetical protein
MTKLTDYQQAKFDEAMLLVLCLVDEVSEGWGEQEEIDVKECITQLCAQIGDDSAICDICDMCDGFGEFQGEYCKKCFVGQLQSERNQLKEENERLKQCTVSKKEILANAIIRAYKEFSEE